MNLRINSNRNRGIILLEAGNQIEEQIVVEKQEVIMEGMQGRILEITEENPCNFLSL